MCPGTSAQGPAWIVMDHSVGGPRSPAPALGFSGIRGVSDHIVLWAHWAGILPSDPELEERDLPAVILSGPVLEAT